jgi:hypothetical protein
VAQIDRIGLEKIAPGMPTGRKVKARLVDNGNQKSQNRSFISVSCRTTKRRSLGQPYQLTSLTDVLVKFI